MPDPVEPSSRLVIRLYSAIHEISRLTSTPRVSGLGPSQENWNERVRAVLRRAHRAVAREPGVRIELEFEPSRAGADAALSKAGKALAAVAASYTERFG